MKEPKREQKTSNPIVEGISMVITLVIMNALMTFVVFLLAAYAIVPLIGDAVSIFSETARYQIVNYLNKGQDVVYGICAVIAMFPSCILTYRLIKERRTIFIRETSGKIPTKDGVHYHLNKYKIVEAIEIVGVAVASLVNAIITDTFNITPFYIFYRYCGIPLGFVLSAAVMCAAQLAAILSAQNYWRADYFCDEE